MNDQLVTPVLPLRLVPADVSSFPNLRLAEFKPDVLREYATHDVVNFLLTRASMDDVAQFFVLQTLARFGLSQISIYGLGNDSLLSLLGTFGQTLGKGDLDVKSCRDDSPWSHALRNGIAKVNFSQIATTRVVPLRVVDGAERPHILWPLLTAHRLCGVMQLRCATEPNLEELRRALSVLTPPITLVVDLASRSGSPIGPSPANCMSTGR